MKIFTVLMLALTTMPCFATNPSAKDQLNALGSDLLLQVDKVSKDTTTKTTQKSAQGTNCPNGTKYDTNKQNCIYEKQPISSSTNNCFVYSFSYYTSLSGDLLEEQDKDFTQWQNACKNLASCKNAKEMTWEKGGKRGLKASDQADIYYCDPKTCLDGSQPKDYKCPEKNQNIEKSETRKEAKAQSAAEEKYESDINELIDAYNTAMKKFVSECTSNGKTFKNMGCEE